MTFLDIKDLTISYGNTIVIKDLSLSMEKGEILVVLGPSGCGKSTLLKTIAGLEKQDSGTITVDGEEITPMSPEKRPTSMVFQKALLFRNMTVAENINYAPRINGTMKGDELKDATDEMLARIGLEGYGDRKATQLSGGQEQRVSLARALITKPKLLLLDEPLSALDAELRVSMRKMIRDVCKSLGQTVIFVTHDQQEAVAIGDRVALMMNGRIKQISEPNDYYHKPCCRRTAMFFGWKNAIPAVQNGKEVSCQLGEYHLDNLDDMNGEVTLLIHPQAAIFKEDGAFTGIIKEATYLGPVSDYTVDCNGVTLQIQVSCRNICLVGESMRFDLDPNMMWTVDKEPDAQIVQEAPKEKEGFLKKLFKR